MKRKKLVATGLAFCMFAAMGTTALAADGTAAESPAGSGLTNPSTGSAAISSQDGITFNTTDDDDAIAADADTSGADINVWAKVIDSGSKIYKVDLAWGAMKFEFNSGSGQWNTTSHAYDSAGATASWTPSYIDGANNKVDVINHSNNAIDATFAYAMENQAFNDTASADAVVGNFFAGNDKAIEAVKVVTGVTSVTDKLTDSKISLPTADAYAAVVAGERTGNVFFAFSGTPDAGRGAVLDSFKKVGVITVTVAPNNEDSLNK